MIALLKKFFSRYTLIALVAIMAFSAVGVSSASATPLLGDVGPELTLSNVKVQSQDSLRHDEAIQSFLGLNESKALSITVVSAKLITCDVGYSASCPFNTGTSGTSLQETSFRYGTDVQAFVITFVYNGQTLTVTLEKRCENVLSKTQLQIGTKPQPKPKPVPVSHTKVIEIPILVQASAQAKYSCNGVTTIASSSASVKTVIIKVSPKSSGWKAFIKAIKVSATTSSKCTKTKTTPTATPAPATITCSNGEVLTVASGSACQSGSATSTATVTPTATGTTTCGNNSSCPTTVYNITVTNQYTTNINANCSSITINYSDGTSNTTYYNAPNGAGQEINQGQCDAATQTTTTTTTTSTPTPPAPTPPTPPTPTMSVSDVTTPQEVYNDGEIYKNLYATVTAPSGDKLTCNISVIDPSNTSQSGYSTIIGSKSVTFTSTGSDTIGDWSMQAPNDGTDSDVGQQDQLKVNCVDDSNANVVSESAYSKAFTIEAAPSNP